MRTSHKIHRNEFIVNYNEAVWFGLEQPAMCSQGKLRLSGAWGAFGQSHRPAAQTIAGRIYFFTFLLLLEKNHLNCI